MSDMGAGSGSCGIIGLDVNGVPVCGVDVVKLYDPESWDDVLVRSVSAGRMSSTSEAFVIVNGALSCDANHTKGS